jgi:Flp pilus assembly protein TadG
MWHGSRQLAIQTEPTCVSRRACDRANSLPWGMKGLRRRQSTRQSGQVLVLVALALPLFFAVCLLAIDGSRLYVQKRSMQNAAAATALAAAKELTLGAPCDATCEANVKAKAQEYSIDNGGPSVLTNCNGDASKTNCYQFSNGDQKVQVRLKSPNPVSNFFGPVLSLFGGSITNFQPSARAAAVKAPVNGDVVTPGVISNVGGAPAILFAYDNYPADSACGTGPAAAISMSGSDNIFDGAVYSNGGMASPGSNNGGPNSYLYYTKPCSATAAVTWAHVEQKDDPVDWPVAIPTLTRPAASKTVTNKAMTGGVVTLTTSSAHTLSVGDSVTVNIGDSRFNGTYTVSAVPSATTFSYTPTVVVATITNKAVASGVVTLSTSTGPPFNTGESVVASIGDSRFDGTVALTGVNTVAHTFSYAPATLAFTSWSWNLTTHTATVSRTASHALASGDVVNLSGFGAGQNCLNNTFSVTNPTSTSFQVAAPLCSMASSGTANRAISVTLTTVASAAASGNATLTTVPSAATTGTVMVPGNTITAVTDDNGNTASCTLVNGSADVSTTWTTAPTNLTAGVYCSSQGLTINSNQTNGVAFVAPDISVSQSGDTIKGNTALYSTEGGLLFYAYGTGGVASTGQNGDSIKGAIFAPLGAARIPGGGTINACSGSNSCGFIQAKTIAYPGSNSTYKGLGPPIGGTPECRVNGVLLPGWQPGDPCETHQTVVTGEQLSLDE